jgi:putative Mn2+ efflux pump MntP
MPCFGYHLTSLFKTIIGPYAKIIVFTIFVYLGLKFIKESFESNKNQPNCIGIICLLLIGIATSIDAFSAGISLSLYRNRILKPALLMTITTFINSIIGFTIGQKLKNLPTQPLEIIAGIILIFLGIKTLF